MASVAGNLPHELLILINENLSAEDRYASLFVCRQWYIVFVQLFYKSVTIMSLSRCNKFYRTLQQSAKQRQFPLQPLALGLIVRGLTIKQHSPPPKIMQQLPSLCPNLESLEFIKTEDRLVSYDKDLSERYTASLTPNRGVMSQLLFTYYRHLPLTHLSLECYSGVRNLVFLAVMPQLEHLTLKLKGEWRMDDMDMVHSLCPQLQSLQVTATLFEFSMHDGINFDFETEPALHLTKIRLNIDRGLSASGYLPWIVYFARKYPRLQELYLGGRFDPEIAYDLFPEDDGRRDNDILPVTLFPEVAQFRQERDETRTRAYAIFFKSCRELRSLNLTNMRLYRGFFDEMVHNGGVLPLQHLAIHDEMLFPRTPIRNAVLLFSQTLTSLSLYAENNGDGDWRFTAQLDVPGLLGHLPQLRHLSLGDMHDISLSTMLDKAPQLETLMVVHVRLNLQHWHGRDANSDDVDSDEETAEPDRQGDHEVTGLGRLHLRPNLKELTIQRTPLTQNILDHISRRCTGLTHITLEHCGVHGSQSGSLILDMPYHQLQMLHLDNLVFKDDEGFLRYYTGEDFHVKTFAVQTEDTGCRCFRFHTIPLKQQVCLSDTGMLSMVRNRGQDAARRRTRCSGCGWYARQSCPWRGAARHPSSPACGYGRAQAAAFQTWQEESETRTRTVRRLRNRPSEKRSPVLRKSEASSERLGALTQAATLCKYPFPLLLYSSRYQANEHKHFLPLFTVVRHRDASCDIMC